MATYNPIITQIGQELILDSLANGTVINLKYFAWGDGGGFIQTANENQTQLVNEVYRQQITSKYINSDVDIWLEILTVVPADIGGFYIREVGIFTENNELFCVAPHPEVYKNIPEDGAVYDFREKLIIEIANLPDINITLEVGELQTHNSDPHAHEGIWVLRAGDVMTGNLTIPDGVQLEHAVNLGQLQNAISNIPPPVVNSNIYLFPEYCVNSGNTTSEGYGDILERVSDTEVSFKVGGVYDNLVVTFPNGKQYEISSIPNITNLDADGTYTLIIEESNIAQLPNNTYSAIATSVKLAYASEESAIPIMLSNSQDGVTTSTICLSPASLTTPYTANAYKVFDSNLNTSCTLRGLWFNNDTQSNQDGEDAIFIKGTTPFKLTKAQIYSTATNNYLQAGGLYGVYIYGSNNTTTGLDGTWTLVLSAVKPSGSGQTFQGNEIYPAISGIGEYSNYRITISTNRAGGNFNPCSSWLNEVKLFKEVVYSGGNITEGWTAPETQDTSIVPIMTSNTSGGYSVYRSSVQLDEAWRAFNQNTGTWWTSQVGAGMPQWVAMKLPSGKTLTGYGWNTGNGGNGTYSWKFQGSNNTTNGSDGTWVDLDTRSSITIATATQSSYSFTNSTSYTAYRLYFSTSAQSTYVIVSNIMFYETITVADGDYHLFINEKPYNPVKRIASTWTQKQFVKLGEITRTSGIMGVPITYAFNRKYMSGEVQVVTPITITKNHYIGINPNYTTCRVFLKCKTAELGYSVGDIVELVQFNGNTSSYQPNIMPIHTKNTVNLKVYNSNVPMLVNKNDGTLVNITPANWYIVLSVKGEL